MRLVRFNPGDRFQRLTVLGREGSDPVGRSTWRVRCECGNAVVMDATAVRKRYSCGCISKNASTEPKAGERFGSLTAVKRVPARPSSRHLMWLYRCDCGNEVVRAAARIRRAPDPNCGCRRASSIPPLEDRILSRCKIAESGCLEWQGPTNKGYGYLGNHATYRAMYEARRGPIPPGMEIDHLCRNTLCCNPDHLEVVTKSENSRRMNAANAKPTCKYGHPWSPENTTVYRGRRWCKACQARRQKDLRARRKATLS